jgi:hypothetical protein
MALSDITSATTAGKIQWRLHDNGNGYHAAVENEYRLDLVDGTFTLRKAGVVLDTQTDTDDVLLTAVEAWIDSTKTEAVSDFLSKITTEA